MPVKQFAHSRRRTNIPPISWDFLGFNTVSPASWEPLQSWENWDNLVTDIVTLLANIVAIINTYNHTQLL